MRQKKRIILSGRTSRHLIDLRSGGAAVSAGTERLVEASTRPHLWERMTTGLWPSRPVRKAHDHVPEERELSAFRHPAVDFAHGEWMSLPVPENDAMHEVILPRTRWGRAIADLTAIELGHTLGFDPVFRACGRVVNAFFDAAQRGLAFVPLRVAVLRQLAVFLLVACMLVAPIGVMSAWGHLALFQELLRTTRPRTEEIVRVIMTAVARGAWNDVAIAAGQLSVHVAALERSVTATPSFLRRVAALLPRVGDAVRGGEALLHDGQILTEELGRVAHTLAAEGSTLAPATFHRAAPALAALFAAAARLETHLALVAGAPLSQPMRENVVSATTALSSLRSSFALGAHATTLLDVGLGFDRPRRYLVLFQNPNEQRGTGGFLGSYGVVDIAGGHVTSWTIPPEGTYGLRTMRTARVAAPRPLQLVNAEWEFQDANWWPEWPATARKILWFWETAGQPSVDGVIVVNGTLLQDVLRIVGPVVLRDGTRIEADTALLTLERAIVKERRQENRRQPKRILGVLAEALQDRLAHPSLETSIALGQTFLAALARREVMMWSADAALATHIAALGWDGSRLPTARDYLQVVHANIGGGKTDAVIDDSLAHTVFVQPDGTAIVTVALERVHRGVRGNVLTGVQNNDYVRVYVPKGAVLIDAWGFTTIPESQFESPLVALAFDDDLGARETAWRRDARTGLDMYEEGGKTVFGGWMLTRPGERSNTGLRYQLPFRVRPFENERKGIARVLHALKQTPTFVPYDLVIVRQPGSRTHITSRLTTPASWETVWRYPLTTAVTPATVSYDGALEEDLWLGAVWKQ